PPDEPGGELDARVLLQTDLRHQVRRRKSGQPEPVACGEAEQGRAPGHLADTDLARAALRTRGLRRVHERRAGTAFLYAQPSVRPGTPEIGVPGRDERKERGHLS